MVTRAATAAVLALAVAASPARADDPAVAARLDAARAHKAALRYREALAEIDAAIALGRAGHDELAALYRLAGELTAGMDRPAAAEDWFARWLALETHGALSDDDSPKLHAALARARARTGGPAAAPATSAAPPSTPLHRDWRLYGAVSGGLALAGGVFAWRADAAQGEFDRLRADSEQHTFAELDLVRARGERHALLANLGLGLAAASAVTAVIVWTRRPRPVRLTIGAAGDGPAVTIDGRF